MAEAGADMVCAQAAEAGGHRGGFLGDPTEGAVGLVALVPLIRDAVDIPVIAAGGLMDGRGIAAALALGADAAQLGTAFLLSPEAGTSEPYRHAVAAAAETDTMLTSAFSGKPARGIRNRMASELAGTELPPYPLTNAITRDLRRRAAEAGLSDYPHCGPGREYRWRGRSPPPSSSSGSSARPPRRCGGSPPRTPAPAPPASGRPAQSAANTPGIGRERNGTEAVPAQMPGRSSSRSWCTAGPPRVARPALGAASGAGAARRHFPRPDARRYRHQGSGRRHSRRSVWPWRRPSSINSYMIRDPARALDPDRPGTRSGGSVDAEVFAEVLAETRRFVRERVVPAEAEIEEKDEIPEDIRQAARQMGLYGFALPEQYGGLGLSMVEEVQLAIELGYTTPALRSLFGTNNGIAGHVLLLGGTAEQQEHWLPRLASGEVTASFALTEPEAAARTRPPSPPGPTGMGRTGC